MDGIQGRFDGHPIDLHFGQFAGAFDMDVEDTYDQEVYFVVRARVVGAKMGETRGGDLKRTNVYAINGVNTIDPDVGFKLQTMKEAQLMFGSDLLDVGTGELSTVEEEEEFAN